MTERDKPFIVMHVIMGVGRIFSRGGAKCGEICFLPLEIEETTFFANNFKIKGALPPFRRPCACCNYGIWTWYDFTNARRHYVSTDLGRILRCMLQFWAISYVDLQNHQAFSDISHDDFFALLNICFTCDCVTEGFVMLGHPYLLVSALTA